MGLLSSVLLFPITGPLHGLTFILEQIRDQVDVELHEEGRLRNELVLLHVRYELGEITEHEFAALQAGLLGRLNAIRNDAMDAVSNEAPNRDDTGG